MICLGVGEGMMLVIGHPFKARLRTVGATFPLSLLMLRVLTPGFSLIESRCCRLYDGDEMRRVVGKHLEKNTIFRILVVI